MKLNPERGALIGLGCLGLAAEALYLAFFPIIAANHDIRPLMAEGCWLSRTITVDLGTWMARHHLLGCGPALPLCWGITWLGAVWLTRFLDSPAGRRSACYIAVAGLCVFAFTFMLCPNLSSFDALVYLRAGRIAAIHHQNPYVTMIGSVKDDELAADMGPYVDLDQAPPYGPLWLGSCTALVSLSGHDVFWNMMALRIMNVLLFLLLCLVAWRLASRQGPETALQCLFWIGWSPFVLFEGVGDCHIDLALALGATTFFWLASRQDWRAASLALGLTCAIKYSAWFLVPLFGAYQFRVGQRQRLVPLLLFAAPMLGGFLFYGTAMTGSIRQSLQLMGHYSNSFVMVAHYVIGHALLRLGASNQSVLLVLDGIRHLCTLVFLAYVGVVTWRLGSDFEGLVARGAECSGLQHILVVSYFHPWYLLVPLTLAFVSASRLRTALVVFALTSFYMEVFWVETSSQSEAMLKLSAILAVPVLLTVLAMSRKPKGAS
jgi:hypothetical protein